MIKRCDWARSEKAIAYHDTEWGVPLHDDRALFEFLILEGAQAGLSWETILQKRDNYRPAFDNFEPQKVAAYKARKIEKLLQNRGHRSQSFEDSVRRAECKSLPGSAERIRQFRCLCLAVCKWEADQAQAETAGINAYA